MNQGSAYSSTPSRTLLEPRRSTAKLLGAEPYADAAYYVGFRVGGLEVGLDPHGHRNGAGPVGYAGTDDINAHLQSLLDAGAQLLQDVTDVGGGRLTATVKDADGNVVGLTQSP